MSYCRTSSDNGKSDFYIFGTRNKDQNIEWHVVLAANRIDLEATKGMTIEERIADLVAAFAEERLPLGVIPIDLPHAGELFVCHSPGEAADKAEELAQLGYHLPKKAVARLRAEQAELDSLKA